MTVTIRAVGNSKGIIIPAKTLREVGIGKVADLRVEEDCIVIRAKKHPRDGWLEAIKNNPPEKEDTVFMDGIEDAEFLEEWTW